MNFHADISVRTHLMAFKFTSRGKLLVHSSFSRARQSKFDVLQSWFKCELLKYKRSNLKLKKFYHWVTIRHTTT